MIAHGQPVVKLTVPSPVSVRAALLLVWASAALKLAALW